MNHNLLSIQLILHEITQFLLSNVFLSYLRCYKLVDHWHCWHCFDCLSIWYLNYLMSCNRMYHLFCPAFNEPICMYTINTQKLKWPSLEKSCLRNLLLELCTLMHKHDNSTSTLCYQVLSYLCWHVPAILVAVYSEFSGLAIR